MKRTSFAANRQYKFSVFPVYTQDIMVTCFVFFPLKNSFLSFSFSFSYSFPPFFPQENSSIIGGENTKTMT